MQDTWRAKLADGSEWEETTPSLQGHGRSPFRHLQTLGRVVLVEAALGLRRVSLESNGWPLVTGQAVDVLVQLSGGAVQSVRYRWVCRQEKRRWVWRITDGIKAWEVETPPGKRGAEDMPRPHSWESLS